MNSLRYKDELYETRPVRDLRELMNGAAELYGDRAAYLVRGAAGFRPVTYREFRSDVSALGAALLADGRLPGRIAIRSKNRYEYVVTYFAVVCGGGVIVPLDPRLPDDEAAGLMRKAEARLLPMDDVRDLIARGRELIGSGDDRYFGIEIDPHRVCALLFTSGTTGAAKGVMLSHANLISNVRGMSAFIDARGMTSLSVLPMHHTLEFTCDILAAMYQGATVAICEGLRYVMRDLAESGAEVIIGVPLVFEKMHRNIMKTAERAGRGELLRGMIDLARLAEGRLPARLMFRSVHRALGGHLRLFLVGGAPCDPRIISDFNAMGIRMIQGYGMTESAPIISVGKDRCSRDDSVGLPLHGTYVQIDDADADGIGEIVVSGPSVMLGYYGDGEATRAAMPDGRLHTGDLGRFDAEGFLYIAGRKKNLIVLKNGKNVYPEEVEGVLLKSRYIAEAVVTGNDALITAGIYPDADAIRQDFGEVTGDDVCKIIDREVDKGNDALPSHARVRRITLRSTPFAKTATKKIRR
jgi:long-subunit acyl-CoA synthetase (AMP-forming)